MVVVLRVTVVYSVGFGVRKPEFTIGERERERERECVCVCRAGVVGFECARV